MSIRIKEVGKIATRLEILSRRPDTVSLGIKTATAYTVVLKNYGDCIVRDYVDDVCADYEDLTILGTKEVFIGNSRLTEPNPTLELGSIYLAERMAEDEQNAIRRGEVKVSVIKERRFR